MKIQYEIGRAMADVLLNVTGQEYVVKSAGNHRYSSSGTSIDYAAGVLKVPIAFVIELDGISFEQHEYYTRRTGKGISMAFLKMIELLRLRNIL